MQQAIEYRNRHGFSVVPVGRDKKPLIPWQEYQKRKATEEEIKGWFAKNPGANVGIVTGMISNLAVIDIDTPEGQEAIDELIPFELVMPTASTPRGGRHLYFTCPDDKLSNNARALPGCDLRANGGYIVAPPSVGENGKPYAWLLSPDQVASIPPLPEAYLHALTLNKHSYSYKHSLGESDDKYCRQVSPLSSSVVKILQQGTRDNDLFHVANTMIRGGAKPETVSQVLEILARSATPPFPEIELA